MVKPLKLRDHLPLAEVEWAYRGATNPVARSQWQVLWTLARGEATVAGAAATGHSPS